MGRESIEFATSLDTCLLGTRQPGCIFPFSTDADIWLHSALYTLLELCMCFPPGYLWTVSALCQYKFFHCIGTPRCTPPTSESARIHSAYNLTNLSLSSASQIQKCPILWIVLCFLLFFLWIWKHNFWNTIVLLPVPCTSRGVLCWLPRCCMGSKSVGVC